jgi:pimeloyl-ACP methyl ester carboxylesterase
VRAVGFEVDAVHFNGAYRCHTLSGVGHNVPQEAPTIFADAVRDLSGAIAAGFENRLL